MRLRRPLWAMDAGGEMLVETHWPGDGRYALAMAAAEVDRLERMLSRILPDSEVSRLNRARRMEVGEDLARVLTAALELRDRTGGRFDPCAGGGIEWDPETRVARLDPGVAIDLGGVAKGDAADRACAILAKVGPCLVDLGGDVAVAGTPEAGSWPVGVDCGSRELSLALQRGGMATSGIDRRRRRGGDAVARHAVDPATGRPSRTDLLRATAVAGSAAEADALATALLIAGEEAARDLATALGVPAVLVTADGRMALTGGLA
ncbi:MAG: FAD:protein FMN transferase [Thermoleophilia bacterium]